METAHDAGATGIACSLTGIDTVTDKLMATLVQRKGGWLPQGRAEGRCRELPAAAVGEGRRGAEAAEH
eukprot:15447607-Alexandrium_andersonii.AAC.1